MEKHLKILGFRVRDAVTGVEGVAESVCFDLYGCIQAIVRPDVDKKKPNEIPDGRWYDVKRLTVVGKKPVMQVPNFSKPEIGGADKPAFSSHPAR